MIYRVVMNQRRAAASLCAETFSKHCHNLIELTARKVAIWPGRANELEEIILIPIFRGSCGNDLLRQHIQRFFGNRQSIEFATINATQQRCAFDQLIAAQRENAAFRQTAALACLPEPRRSWCSARPTRCSSVAMERVVPN